MSKNTVLLIDDDQNISKVVKLYLEKEDYEVYTAFDGASGLEKFNEISPDIVLLDIMMPGIDGMEVIKEIRKKSTAPVVMLTAKSDTFDKVLGLELGADDYIVKPFEPKELMARVRAVIRRSVNKGEPESDKTVSYDGLKINIADYTVEFEGQEIELPPKELELLYFLATHPNRVFTREQLLQNVWDFDFFGDSRTVDVHVKRLREKIVGDHNWQLKTVWGVGYKFEVK